ncbi:uncharacterized protein METZ01_LOCUS149891, partial [marine metagenome]
MAETVRRLKFGPATVFNDHCFTKFVNTLCNHCSFF